MHLIVPYASALAPGNEAARRDLVLPNLQKLLGRLTPTGGDEGDEFSLSPPHERALARLRGWPVADGLLPFAAQSAADAGLDTDGEGFAFITPCHWQIAPDHIGMMDPDQLPLDEAESRTVLALVRAFFAEDGFQLDYLAPDCWRARGPALATLPTASLDRVRGRSVDLWMPDGLAARPLRRLQTEVQMLLYTHALTDERDRRGLPAVNSFWVSGSGTLPATATGLPTDLVMPQTLRETALREDWPAWREAWKAVDATECARALRALDDGQPVALTLCGERRALGFSDQPRSWLQRARGLWTASPSLPALADRL